MLIICCALVTEGHPAHKKIIFGDIWPNWRVIPENYAA